jgi:hypothetical protein
MIGEPEWVGSLGNLSLSGTGKVEAFTVVLRLAPDPQ